MEQVAFACFNLNVLTSWLNVTEAWTLMKRFPWISPDSPTHQVIDLITVYQHLHLMAVRPCSRDVLLIGPNFANKVRKTGYFLFIIYPYRVADVEVTQLSDNLIHTGLVKHWFIKSLNNADLMKEKHPASDVALFQQTVPGDADQTAVTTCSVLSRLSSFLSHLIFSCLSLLLLLLLSPLAGSRGSGPPSSHHWLSTHLCGTASWAHELSPASSKN